MYRYINICTLIHSTLHVLTFNFAPYIYIYIYIHTHQVLPKMTAQKKEVGQVSCSVINLFSVGRSNKTDT